MSQLDTCSAQLKHQEGHSKRVHRYTEDECEQTTVTVVTSSSFSSALQSNTLRSFSSKSAASRVLPPRVPPSSGVRRIAYPAFHIAGRFIDGPLFSSRLKGSFHMAAKSRSVLLKRALRAISKVILHTQKHLRALHTATRKECI